MKPQRYFIVLIIVLAVLFIWWMFSSGNQATAPSPNPSPQTQLETPSSPTTTNTTATNQLTKTDTIIVSNHNAVSVATIDNLNLSEPSFIVIHILDQNNLPVKIIGTSGLLSKGIKQDLQIKLSEKLISSNQYTASIYLDDGDKIFNNTKDQVIISNNKPVQALFKVGN
jgi:hypothetical protein